MATRKNFYSRVDKRRADAILRQEVRAKRSDKQQLELLIKKGHEHCKEAKRLREKLNA